jgi:quercetin dioxygenase-like cupin family protein
MKLRLDNKDSKIVKDNDTYRLIDNTSLNNLVVSKTILHPGKCTNGHDHVGQEEVYQFTSGHGTMTVGDNSYMVVPGDVISIPDGAFHKVWNNSETEDLVFVCVFDGKRNH